MTENSVSRPLTLGVILYPGFELLDVFGPLEMFTAVGRDRLTTYLIAERAGPVPAGIVPDGPVGPRVTAEFGFDDAPHLDLLLIPGGIGTFPELANERLMTFLRERARRAQITASVCTGSALLAKSRRTRRPSRHIEQAVLQPRRRAEQRGRLDRGGALGRRRRRRHVVRRLRRHGHGARDHRAIVRRGNRRGHRGGHRVHAASRRRRRSVRRAPEQIDADGRRARKSLT